MTSMEVGATAKKSKTMKRSSTGIGQVALADKFTTSDSSHQRKRMGIREEAEVEHRDVTKH